MKNLFCFCLVVFVVVVMALTTWDSQEAIDLCKSKGYSEGYCFNAINR
jgi:hypothetical protein